MRIAVTGSSGLIGGHLSRSLEAAGHTAVPIVRRAAGDGEIHWDPRGGQMSPADLVGIDAVVHLAGAGIGDRRWSAGYKREILESRTLSTRLLAETMSASLPDGGPRRLLSGSAIGVYGASDDRMLDESSGAGEGFLADVCHDWEAAAEPATAAGVSVAYLRTGIVLSPNGGALKKLLPLFKLGAGGRMGSGSQWQSWISIDDESRAIIHLLTSTLEGAVNLTAPEPVTNAEFSRTLGRVVGRPALLPVPRFGPALLLGSELADALLFTGQRVLPSALLADGFVFDHPELEGALRALLGRRAA